MSNTKDWQPVEPQPRDFPKPVAPDGQIYVCAACGKTTKDIYESGTGWDVSCVMNSVLCWEAPPDE